MRSYAIVLIEPPLSRIRRLRIQAIWDNSPMSGIGWVVLDDFPSHAEARAAMPSFKHEHLRAA